MSNKVELQSNNTDIQNIIDRVKELPSASKIGEALNSEITEQENLITQIVVVLEGKGYSVQ